MAHKISVSSFNEMAEAAKKLASFSDEYKSISEKLMREASTMGEAWQGADNAQFVEQIKGFSKELNDMSKKLKLSSETLNKQRQNYVDRQNDNISQVKKLKN